MDTDSSRLMVLSACLLALVIGTEIAVLFAGLPQALDPIIAGRVLGLMDATALIILQYHYGSSSSARKTEIQAQAESAPP